MGLVNSRVSTHGVGGFEVALFVVGLVAVDRDVAAAADVEVVVSDWVGDGDAFAGFLVVSVASVEIGCEDVVVEVDLVGGGVEVEEVAE